MRLQSQLLEKLRQEFQASLDNIARIISKNSRETSPSAYKKRKKLGREGGDALALFAARAAEIWGCDVRVCILQPRLSCPDAAWSGQ